MKKCKETVALSLGELSDRYGLDLAFVGKAFRNGLLPASQLSVVDGRWTILCTPHEMDELGARLRRANGRSLARVKYDTTVRDAEAYRAAQTALAEYARAVGSDKKAREKLFELFGVTKVSELDVARQRAAATVFLARAYRKPI